MTEVQFGKDRYHQYQDMMSWCSNQFGSGVWGIPDSTCHRWGIQIAFGNSTFLFNDPEDAVLFKLVWA